MSTPHETEAKAAARRGMAFRKNSRIALPTPEGSRRQASVVQSAWRQFGEPGPVIAFLNTPNAVLKGQPLHSQSRATRAWDVSKPCSSK